MIVTQSDNTITYRMGGQTLLLDVPGHVNTIQQFKNNLLRIYKNYSYDNLLVCYIRQGIDYVPYDDTLIDFNQTYYVIRRPIECDSHVDPNNVRLVINFDSESDSEESDSDDDDMPELESVIGSDNEDEDEDGDNNDKDDDADESNDEDDNMSLDYNNSDYNEPIEME